MDSKKSRNLDILLSDDSFQKYVVGSDQTSIEFWDDWIKQHPEKKSEIEKSAKVILTLSKTRKQTVNDHKNNALKYLLSEIQRLDETEKKEIKKIKVSILRGIAASLLILFGLAAGLIFKSQPGQVIAQSDNYNEIIVPVGEKSQIILSDGTHVWVNSGSRLTYPVYFGSESRNVTLEGEAYFEVTKQNESIFTVTTHDAKIQALGTSFNVKSYPEDFKTQTTVVSGLVKIETMQLDIEPILVKPNQMATIADKSEENNTPVESSKLPELIVVDRVNTEALTSWKDHLLVFADETFEDIAVKMERWFNVQIEIADEDLKSERYTGKFIYNETIYEVLEVIKTTTLLDYSVRLDKITIYKK